MRFSRLRFEGYDRFRRRKCREFKLWKFDRDGRDIDRHQLRRRRQEWSEGARLVGAGERQKRDDRGGMHAERDGGAEPDRSGVALRVCVGKKLPLVADCNVRYTGFLREGEHVSDVSVEEAKF